MVQQLRRKPNVIEVNKMVEDIDQDTQDDTPQNLNDNNQKDVWVFYENKDIGFSIKHPDYLEPEEQQDGSIGIFFLGPTQKTETEFYDGISLYFKLTPLEGKDLIDIVEENRRIFVDLYGDSVSKISEIVVDLVSGFVFSDEKGQYIYLGVGNNNYLEINNMTVDPGDLGYKQTASDILESAKIYK